MSDDTVAAALHARLKTIIKEVEDAEAQDAAARCPSACAIFACIGPKM
jgi:hypothetical protein